MFTKKCFKEKVEEVKNIKKISETLEISNLEIKVREKAEFLLKIDFSGDINNDESEKIKQKIDSFDKAIKECLDGTEKDILEEARKKLVDELSSKRNPTIERAASIAQEILSICKEYQTFDTAQAEKAVKELKDMVTYLSPREDEFKGKKTTLPLLIEACEKLSNKEAAEKSRKELADVEEWMALITEAKNLISLPQETQKKEEAEISDEELFQNFKNVLEKTENNLIVSAFDKALWRKCFKDSVLSEMKGEEVYKLAALLCSEWAIKFKLSSNLFKAVREFLADDEKVCELIAESEAIKTNLIGREPISFRKNDEYCGVIHSYVDALILNDKEKIESFKKSAFIFNDDQKLENLYTK